VGKSWRDDKGRHIGGKVENTALGPAGEKALKEREGVHRKRLLNGEKSTWESRRREQNFIC